MAKRFITENEYLKLSSLQLGERIRFIREQLGILYDNKADFTTTNLAKRANMTPQALTAIERGDSKNPSFNLIQRLAETFNVSMDVFTDRYYETNEVKLFTIGFDDNKLGETNNLELNDMKLIEDKFHIGTILYQVLKDETVRIVFNDTTKSMVDKDILINTMARMYLEMQLIDKDNIDSHLKNNNPHNLALNRYESIFNYPDTFPTRSKQEWDKLISIFRK
jgi:transcriptional regulator with XRE-family HTH domain